MLDLAFVRANLPIVEERLRARGTDPRAILGDFTTIDARRREAITRAETLKAERNRITIEVAAVRRAGGDASTLMEQTRGLKEQVDLLEAEAALADAVLQTRLQGLPNLPQGDVPVGSNETQNVVIKTWGEPTTLPFPARSHWELGEDLGLLDFERAAKISGSRFAVHYGPGARMERALASFMLDLHTAEHGYTEVLPPAMVNSRSLFGTGQLPKFAEDLFHCDDRGAYNPGVYEENDHWLIPTAEVPVTNLLRDEVLDATELPVRFCACTSCFRSEAGSYGRDVRGLIRQHQFQKVELVQFVAPEESAAALESLTRHAETVLERLGLPYRRMLLCTGDMGANSAKTFDLEVWLPGQSLYREISSCSNFEAFQARRANIRFRPDAATAQKGRRPEFVHTLNGSGLAIGRTYVAILENYQQADGNVRIPDALLPYMGGLTHLTSQPRIADAARAHAGGSLA